MADPIQFQKSIALQPNMQERLKEQDQQIRDAAKMYEQQFLGEMVKAMRQTVQEDGVVKTNFAEKLYRQQLDDQYVDSWSAQGGVGLSEIIYKQIKERYFPEAPSPTPQGPIQLKKTHELQQSDQMKTFMSIQPEKGASFRFEFMKDFKGEAPEVVSPWEAKVLSAFQTADGQQIVKLSHGDKCQSLLAFNGRRTELKVGDEIHTGQKLGVLDPSRLNLNWRLDLT